MISFACGKKWLQTPLSIACLIMKHECISDHYFRYKFSSIWSLYHFIAGFWFSMFQGWSTNNTKLEETVSSQFDRRGFFLSLFHLIFDFRNFFVLHFMNVLPLAAMRLFGALADQQQFGCLANTAVWLLPESPEWDIMSTWYAMIDSLLGDNNESFPVVATSDCLFLLRSLWTICTEVSIEV